MEKVISYLINQVPKSHPRMLVMACFCKSQHEDRQEHFKQKNISYSDKMEHGSAFRSLRKAHGDGARSTDQKSGVYRDDRIVHFDGDPEEFADGDTRRRRYAHSKLWTRPSSKISQKARS
jgi:hypothetical protein